MSIAQVITGGYGSFGSVNKLPTLGFDIAEITVASVEGLEYTLPSNRLHFAIPTDDMDYTLPGNKLHWTMDEEN